MPVLDLQLLFLGSTIVLETDYNRETTPGCWLLCRSYQRAGAILQDFGAARWLGLGDRSCLRRTLWFFFLFICFFSFFCLFLSLSHYIDGVELLLSIQPASQVLPCLIVHNTTHTHLTGTPNVIDLQAPRPLQTTVVATSAVLAQSFSIPLILNIQP